MNGAPGRVVSGSIHQEDADVMGEHHRPPMGGAFSETSSMISALNKDQVTSLDAWAGQHDEGVGQEASIQYATQIRRVEVGGCG
jgi:hypothetical protein